MGFCPFLGQLKGLADAIIGYNIITGEKLEPWERGLNVLMAVIPEAKGIFGAGEDGLRVLAGVAVHSDQTAEEIYRVTKGASRLTVEEVQAAKAAARVTVEETKAAEALKRFTPEELKRFAAASRVPVEDLSDGRRAREAEATQKLAASGAATRRISGKSRANCM